MSELVITTEGLSEITIAQAIPVPDPSTAIVEWDETMCDFDDPATDYSGWKPAYPLTESGKFPFFPTLNGTTQSSPVMGITVQSTEIRTAEGLGVNSTVAEIKAAYGSELVVISNDYITGYSLHGTAGQLVFWVQDKTTVGPLEVFPIGVTPEFSFHVTGCA